jgi:integrase
MPRLTKTVVDQFTATRDTTLGDTLLPGFGVRLRPPNPQKVFYVQYRTPQGQRRRKLGVYGVLTVEEARELARQWLVQVAQGHDPAQREDTAQVLTVAALARRYLLTHAQAKKKAASLRHDQTILRCHVLPALGERAVAQLTRADITALHHGLADRPTMANRVLALLSVMCGLAEQWGLRDVGSNPAQGIPRYPETPRERYLTPEELTRLWRVLEEGQRTQAVNLVGLAALRVLLLTGARVGEILTLRWAVIDWQHGRARLAESKTGAKTLFLAPEALDVLRRMPRLVGCPWCFPSVQAGKHFVALPRLWYRIRREAGLVDVRLHDLRHTFAATAASMGVPLLTIGALLGHRRASSTQRYAHLMPEIADEAARVVARKVRGGHGESRR